MLNKIIVMGRLTKDPELRQTHNGTPVAMFSLAVERNYTKEGAREVDFFDVVAWQNRAEFVSKYFVKGQLVCVEGRLQRRMWTDKDDNTRYAFEIIAESVHFAGLNKNDSQNQNDTGDLFDPFAEEAA
jgi:single-strand DNA-binding protein